MSLEQRMKFYEEQQKLDQHFCHAKDGEDLCEICGAHWTKIPLDHIEPVKNGESFTIEWTP